MLSAFLSSGKDEGSLKDDPLISLYIIRNHMVDTGISTGETTEQWDEGDSIAILTFKNTTHLLFFKKMFNYYRPLMVKLPFSVNNICRTRTRKIIKRYMDKRRDISIRIIDDQLWICASQETVDAEAAGLENDLMGSACDERCEGCHGKAIVYRSREATDKPSFAPPQSEERSNSGLVNSQDDSNSTSFEKDCEFLENPAGEVYDNETQEISKREATDTWYQRAAALICGWRKSTGGESDD